MGAEIILAREGGNPDVVFANPLDYGDLRKSLGSKVEYDMVRGAGDMAVFGFEAIKLMGSQGPIKVVADRNCPQGVAYMLQLDTWSLASLGPAPKLLSGQGLQFLWDQTADSIEVRVGYYANLGCYAPGFNARITLPA